MMKDTTRYAWLSIGTLLLTRVLIDADQAADFDNHVIELYGAYLLSLLCLYIVESLTTLATGMHPSLKIQRITLTAVAALLYWEAPVAPILQIWNGIGVFMMIYHIIRYRNKK